MANVLRNQNDLITLRCRLALDEKKWFMASQLWGGSHEISREVFTPLSELGIILSKAEKAYRTSEFSFGNSGVREQLLQAAAIAQVDTRKAIWLQLSRNAQALSALPWESLSHDITNRPLLRIPNYLIDPFSPTEQPNIAICASAPLAKTDYNIRDYVNVALIAIDNLQKQSTVYRTKVTLFLDEAENYRAQQEGYLVDNHSLDIIIAHPENAGAFGVATETYGEIGGPKKGIRNPWLLWILDHFKKESVDSVHFISPSYFAGQSGALALAPSPLVNNDRKWSRFIGAQELSVFCDRLNCNSILFSSASSPYWRIGHRLLVNELSWLRPGPIIHFDDSTGNEMALHNIYAIIYGRESFHSNQDFAIQASLHPDIIKRGNFDFDIYERSAMQLDGDTFSKFIQFNETESVLDFQLSRNSKARMRGLSYAGDEPIASKNMKILAQKRAKLSQLVTKSPQQKQVDEGRMKALDFLSNLPDFPEDDEL